MKQNKKIKKNKNGENSFKKFTKRENSLHKRK